MLEQHHKSLTLNSQYFACIIKLKLRQAKTSIFTEVERRQMFRPERIKQCRTCCLKQTLRKQF